MKISGSYVLPIGNTVLAYAALQDPVILAKCMPGCESLEKIGEDEYAVKLKMAIAAFSGLFAGKVRIADAQPHSQFKLIVEGSGKIGFMKGEGLMKLASVEDGTKTQVDYEGDVQIGGTLAAVGQRLVDSTSKMMVKRFFDKIAEELTAKPSSASA
jgi:carbon monoxide dehydrogenase subunit G